MVDLGYSPLCFFFYTEHSVSELAAKADTTTHVRVGFTFRSFLIWFKPPTGYGSWLGEKEHKAKATTFIQTPGYGSWLFFLHIKREYFCINFFLLSQNII